MDAFHPIQMAARMSGLSPTLIRVWEQRYAAVEPARTSTKRRLYSQTDIERLALLKELTQAGHSISQIAKLPDGTLRELAGRAQKTTEKDPISNRPGGHGDAEHWVRDAIIAIQLLDAPGLDKALKNAARSLGAHGTLQRVVAPLAESVGELWRAGEITAAHEHFGTGRIRAFLNQMSKPFAESDRGPVLVVATPAGQLHEMGALIAGASATHLGWRVTHLGASLPAAEIAGAARQKQARAVALSFIYPEDDPALEGELGLLRELLPKETALIVGGRGIRGYRDILTQVGAVLVSDLSHLGEVLDGLRTQPESRGREGGGGV